jgi:hypothetical protein
MNPFKASTSKTIAIGGQVNRTVLLNWTGAVLLLALGLGIRLFDLTDPPLDFHPTRQLRSAIIARGMYYEMLPGADPEQVTEAVFFWRATGQYEPPILERLVALTYLALGREEVWISRIFTGIFWVIGGLALYDLARRMALSGRENSPGTAGAIALIPLAYYLILPFAVQASRSFQPDPWMVMWIILAVYALYRWTEEQNWRWAIAAGLLGGMAVLVKAVAAYIVGGAAVALVLYALGLRRAWRSPQVWAMAGLMVAPSIVYYLIVSGGRAGRYFENWTLSLSHLLLSPATYARWFNLVQSLMGITPLLMGLIGVLIARPKSRALLLGLWGGYWVYGLFLPYQMYTHTYYHLQVVPLVALSLIAPVEALIDRVQLQARWVQLLVVMITMIGALYPAWVSTAEMRRDENRHEPAYWQEIASYLPNDGKIIALTQDYGYRLMYYGWRKVTLWPIRGEQALAAMRGKEREFESYFNKRIENRSYFLITAFGQYSDQPDLQAWLEGHYPVFAQGGGYLIYDLTHPLAQP